MFDEIADQICYMLSQSKLPVTALPAILAVVEYKVKGRDTTPAQALQKEELPKITITIAEAAMLTGIGTAQLREWAEIDSEFPSFLVGNKRLIYVKQFDEYLKNRAALRIGETMHARRRIG